jgi:hypothetical protein
MASTQEVLWPVFFPLKILGVLHLNQPAFKVYGFLFNIYIIYLSISTINFFIKNTSRQYNPFIDFSTAIIGFLAFAQCVANLYCLTFQNSRVSKLIRSISFLCSNLDPQGVILKKIVNCHTRKLLAFSCTFIISGAVEFYSYSRLITSETIKNFAVPYYTIVLSITNYLALTSLASFASQMLHEIERLIVLKVIMQ